jgi:thiamine biosynthesis lipoprotein
MIVRRREGGPVRGHTFRAMGTTVSLLAPGGRSFDRVARAVERAFARADARFSRFRAESELSLVNARSGAWTEVSEPFAELLTFALASAGETGGLFDPTIHDALVAAGYDRDFGSLGAHHGPGGDPPAPGPWWSEIELHGLMLRTPADVRLDLGGVAKGWAVDRGIACSAPLEWAVVNAGGDLRLVGSAPHGLDVDVEDPADPTRSVLRLRLGGGALATSSVRSRTWGEGMHEIIDPRTARPAATGVIQATVWAPTCAMAEVRSTWAVLAGPPVLDRIPGVLVMDDGRILSSLDPDDPVSEPATVGATV